MENVTENTQNQESVVPEQEQSENSGPVLGDSTQKTEEKLPESQKEMKKFIKELKLKVNGKEMVKKIDFDDENSLIREFQMAEANKEGMKKASEYEKAFNQFLKDFQENPRDAMKQLGHDPDKLLEAWVNEKLEEMKKDPRDLEREKFLKEKELAEKRAKDLEEKLKEREFLEEKKAQAELFERQFNDFFQKYPESPEEFKDEIRIRAINVMQKYLEEIPELELKDVLPIVEQQYFEKFNKMVESSPLALIEKLVGKKALDKIRLENIKKMQTTQLDNLNKVVSTAKVPEKKDKKPLVDSKTFFRELEQRIKK